MPNQKRTNSRNSKKEVSKKNPKFRIERDSLGKKKIPKDALYGIETQRAIENFSVSDLRLQRSFIHAYLLIKRAATVANKRLNKIDEKKATAVIKACDLLLDNESEDLFKVDVYQAGAGTSENMNINEVIANTALTMIRKKKGSYEIINPHDHVNLSQSTNDTFHSAMHIAAYTEIQIHLLPQVRKLEKSLEKKGKQFQNIMKSGRTHLRDALPITLGQEFHAYASMIQEDIKHIEEDSKSLLELNIGGTAIGTGVNASKAYQKITIREINKYTKFSFKPAKDLIEATQSLGAVARTSASLKTLALDLIKIANDLRLLSSGPATGLDEIQLPAVQPGSSIMPGKVNPVITEMLDMVAFQAIGNDTTISLAVQAGQLELNVMMPVAAYNLLNSIEILGHAIDIFSEKCIRGIKANEKKCSLYLERNPIIVTALTPYIGYKKAAEIAKQAYQKEKSIKQLILEQGMLNEKEINKILNPVNFAISK